MVCRVVEEGFIHRMVWMKPYTTVIWNWWSKESFGLSFCLPLLGTHFLGYSRSTPFNHTGGPKRESEFLTSSMTQPSEVKQHNPSDRSSGWMKQWKKSIIHPVSASINNNGLSVPCDPLLKSGLLFLDGWDVARQIPPTFLSLGPGIP